MSLPAVQTCALSGWTEMMSRFGVDPADVMKSVGIVPENEPRNPATIPLKAFATMTEFVGKRANHPAASWVIGTEYDLRELGDVGEAVMSAKTLGGALRRFSDHFELLQDSSKLGLEIKDDRAILSYRILDPDIWPRYHDALFSLGIVAQIIRLAVPNALEALELGFESERRETGLTMALSQISFEGDANTLTMPIAMLDASMPDTACECDLRHLSQQLAAKRRHVPASERLASMIFARLPDGGINQDELASEIGMSSRTMRRRLSDEKLTFQQLLDACRMRQAMLEFRARPDSSIAQVALRLGYAEHSNFTRAFTRWAGVPPHKFRSNSVQTTH